MGYTLSVSVEDKSYPQQVTQVLQGQHLGGCCPVFLCRLGELLPASPPMELKFLRFADGRVFCIGLRAIRQQLQEIIFRLP